MDRSVNFNLITVMLAGKAFEAVANDPLVICGKFDAVKQVIAIPRVNNNGAWPAGLLEIAVNNFR